MNRFAIKCRASEKDRRTDGRTDRQQYHANISTGCQQSPTELSQLSAQESVNVLRPM